MKNLLFFLILAFFNSKAWAYQNYYQGRIVLPANYEMFKKQQEENNRLIPDSAQQATSTGAFATAVIDFHFQRYLKNNPNSRFKKIKSFENQINSKTSLGSNDFRIEPKLHITKMRAEISVHSFIKTKMWMDNHFKNFNAQVEIFRSKKGQMSIDHINHPNESRTTLGYKTSW